MRWIDAHLADDLSLPVLASQAGMSERSFSRRYAEATGVTPARAVERLRVEAARLLLSESRLPVKRIAQRCGFGSEETMRRSFLRLLAVTPQDYRARFSMSCPPARLNPSPDPARWARRKGRLLADEVMHARFEPLRGQDGIGDRRRAGIGAATARRFGAEGASVTIIDKTEESLRATAGDLPKRKRARDRSLTSIGPASRRARRRPDGRAVRAARYPDQDNAVQRDHGTACRNDRRRTGGASWRRMWTAFSTSAARPSRI